MKAYRSQFEDIQQRLRQLDPSDADPFKGATNEDILELEAYAGGSFPSVYRVFLEMMGCHAARLFQGSHALLSQRWSLRFREFAETMLSKSGSEASLPDSAFVFLMHQGYVFLYLRLDDGEDPPVYIINDSEPEPKLLSESFTTYIDDCVTGLEELAATRAVS